MAIEKEFGPRFNGVENYDWLRAQKRSDQASIRGTQISVIPQSSRSPICGSLIDSSVNVNGLGGIPITPNTVGPGALTTAIYPAPTYTPVVNPPDPLQTVQPFASLTGLLEDLYCQPVFTNVPQDGSVYGIAWAFRKSADALLAPVGGVDTVKLIRTTQFTNSGNNPGAYLAFTTANAPIAGNLVVITAYSSNGLVALPGWNFSGVSPATGTIINSFCIFWKIWTAGDSLTQEYAGTASGLDSVSSQVQEWSGTNISNTAISQVAFTSSQPMGPVSTPPIIENELLGVPVVGIASLQAEGALNQATYTNGFISDGFACSTYGQNTSFVATGHGPSLLTDLSSAQQSTITPPSDFPTTQQIYGVTYIIRSLNPGAQMSGGLSYPWIIQAITQLTGLPTPPMQQRDFYGFGQVVSGIRYDLGAAYVSMRGEIGQIGAFISSYSAPFKLEIPNHYMLNGANYVPIITMGIPSGTGYPAYTVDYPQSAPAASANGLTYSLTLAFQIKNQPQNGSFSRLKLFFRTKGDPALLTGYTTYGDIRASGVGLPVPGTPGASKTLPLVGNYIFETTDLTNGTDYDFAIAAEDPQGDETILVRLPFVPPAPPPVAPPTLANGSANLVPDSDFAAAGPFRQGQGGFIHTQISNADPLWHFSGIDGVDSVISTENGGVMQQDIAASGKLFYGISSPFDLLPGITYTFSCYFDHDTQINPTSGSTGGPYCALVSPSTNGTIGTVYATSTHGVETVKGTYKNTSANAMRVAFLISNDSCTIKTGGYFRGGKPMVSDSGSTAYVKGPATPPGAVQTTQVLAVSPANTTQATNAASPTITSSPSAPASGTTAPVVDQQPAGSVRISTSGVLYTQTSISATTPVWSPVGGGGSVGIAYGSAFPTNPVPVDKQPFFRTDLSELFIYNSTTAIWILSSVTALGVLTDIDFTTASTGKVLSVVSSNGKAYSFTTPSTNSSASTGMMVNGDSPGPSFMSDGAGQPINVLL